MILWIFWDKNQQIPNCRSCKYFFPCEKKYLRERFLNPVHSTEAFLWISLLGFSSVMSLAMLSHIHPHSPRNHFTGLHKVRTTKRNILATTNMRTGGFKQQCGHQGPQGWRNLKDHKEWLIPYFISVSVTLSLETQQWSSRKQMYNPKPQLWKSLKILFQFPTFSLIANIKGSLSKCNIRVIIFWLHPHLPKTTQF